MSLDFLSTAFCNTVGLVALSAMTLAAGCATEPPSIPAATNTAAPPDPLIGEPLPAVRYGRYTLVDLVPERAQRDPMEQIVDVTIPATVTATVGEALRYVLLRSGYRLCEGHEETRALDALPLPAAHLHLGPLTLREALKILIGSARELEVDEAMRQVCVRLRGSTGSTHAEIALPMPEPSWTDIPSL